MNREFYVLYEGETVRRNLDMLLGALEKQFEGRILVVEQVLRVRTDVESLFPMLEELGIVVGEEVNRKPGNKVTRKRGAVVEPGSPIPATTPGQAPATTPGQAPATTTGQVPATTVPATEDLVSESGHIPYHGGGYVSAQKLYLVGEPGQDPATTNPGSPNPATEEMDGECMDCGKRFKKRVPSQVRCSECSRKKNPWAYGERKAERAPGQGIKARKLG